MPTPQEIIEAFDNEEVDEMCGVSQREWLKQALADYTAYLISVMPEEKNDVVDDPALSAGDYLIDQMCRNSYNSALSHVHDILTNEINKLK